MLTISTKTGLVKRVVESLITRVHYALFWLLAYENNNNENIYIEAQVEWLCC